MSVSDIFAGFGLLSDQSMSTGVGDESPNNTNNSYDNSSTNSHVDAIQEEEGSHTQVELSSFVSFDVESMSVNSDTLQDFGSIVTLPPGTVLGLLRSAASNEPASNDDDSNSISSSLDQSSDGDGTRTILSSQPSGVFIPAPEASQDIFISPHPRFIAGSARSISTVCTETLSYQDRQSTSSIGSGTFGDQEDGLIGDDDTVLSSNMARSQNTNQGVGAEIVQFSMEPNLAGHDTLSFEAVANHLMREAVTDTRGGDWYSQFSDRDWDQFQHVARMVLNTLLPHPSQSWKIALPPSPPEFCRDGGYPDLLESHLSYSVRDILPDSFVCTLCRDVVVGAFTLDCGCPGSTLCTTCWEEHLKGPVQQDFSNRLGFVWVDRNICPSCESSVRDGVPCHALDVAILQIVQNLNTTDPVASSLRNHYFERLGKWGEEVVRRNEEQKKVQMQSQDRLLAQLIHSEEKLIWDRQRRMEAVSNSTRIWLFAGQATVALLAATMASVGVNVLSRR